METSEGKGKGKAKLSEQERHSGSVARLWAVVL